MNQARSHEILLPLMWSPYHRLERTVMTRLGCSTNHRFKSIVHLLWHRQAYDGDHDNNCAFLIHVEKPMSSERVPDSDTKTKNERYASHLHSALIFR